MNTDKTTFLSPPSETSMGEEWFEIATPTHFWMKRRFRVLSKLASALISDSENLAEIGCGNGVLQYQIENAYSKTVDGYDLNSVALGRTIARKSRTFCYDISDRLPSLENKYDLIFLFDVIEHISDENDFINKLLFHLKPGGWLIINVPAINRLYSGYDAAVGHIRRYSINSLNTLGRNCDLIPKKVIYWGLPLLPMLLVRKFLIPTGDFGNQKILQRGFAPPNPFIDKFLYCLSSVESIKVNPIGTSVMGIYQKPL
ncbi:MAG: class I SAM-dependent methyltransferase [Luteolibacter sp.]